MIIALINYALQTTCHGFQQLPEMNMDDLLIYYIYMVTYIVDSRVTMEYSVF